MLNIQQFSTRYQIRQMTKQDVDLLYEFCQGNPQFFQYCGSPLDKQHIEDDLTLCPPGIELKDKYYVGFFLNEQLVAIMDLVDGYPQKAVAFIGFFMMNAKVQGKGEGTRIIEDVQKYLQSCGFEEIRLGIDEGNPQSTHFWNKNGFVVLERVVRETSTILYSAKKIESEGKR